MGQSSGSDSPQKQSYPGKGNMGVDGNKEKSSKSTGFGVQGGNHHMLTGMTAGPQQPGVSSQQGSSNDKYASGGNGKMFHSGNGAADAVAGETAAKFGGGEKWGVEGGKTHMFGPQSAGPAKPA